MPLTDDASAPQSTVMDETYKVAITRLGDRIRVGGTAEVGGYQIKLSEDRRATLERSLKDLFPRGGDIGAASFWSGLRPMTPDGPPIVGPTRYKNLHLNTATAHAWLDHGVRRGPDHQRSVAGRKPEISIEGLSPGTIRVRSGAGR